MTLVLQDANHIRLHFPFPRVSSYENAMAGESGRKGSWAASCFGMKLEEGSVGYYTCTQNKMGASWWGGANR